MSIAHSAHLPTHPQFYIYLDKYYTRGETRPRGGFSDVVTKLFKLLVTLFWDLLYYYYNIFIILNIIIMGWDYIYILI